MDDFVRIAPRPSGSKTTGPVALRVVQCRPHSRPVLQISLDPQALKLALTAKACDVAYSASRRAFRITAGRDFAVGKQKQSPRAFVRVPVPDGLDLGVGPLPAPAVAADGDEIVLTLAPSKVAAVPAASIAPVTRTAAAAASLTHDARVMAAKRAVPAPRF